MNAVALSIKPDRDALMHRSGAAVVVVDNGRDVAAAGNDGAAATVPLKPTAAMLAAGSRAGGVSVEVAWKIYLAMLNEAG